MSVRDAAITYANEAVELDRNERWEEALTAYIKACEYFSVAIKHEKNDRLREHMVQKTVGYMSRAEEIKNSIRVPGKKQKRVATPGGGNEKKAAVEPVPVKDLTEEELEEAGKEMEAELKQLIGMETVKEALRKMCKTLQLDLQRKKAGHEVMAPIRHMVFTGNPGTGKTTIARTVGRLFHRLGLSNSSKVIEVQKSDLVSGYVNQTGMKTREKINEARGGVLFVDEAYQLTDALARGQTDMGGEAVDEIMRVMNETGPDSTTFIFAGYKASMQSFLDYNAGLQSRVRYAFDFEDYTPPELTTILRLKLKAKGWKIHPTLDPQLPSLLAGGTTKDQRAKYNGRLVDNLVQWAADELNNRLTVNASPEDLVTLCAHDIQVALQRFEKPSAGPKMKETDEDTTRVLEKWGLVDIKEKLREKGYTKLTDLLVVSEEDCTRTLGLDANSLVMKKLMTLVATLRKERVSLGLGPQKVAAATDLASFLESVDCSEYLQLFIAHKVDFSTMLLLTYDDLKEIGVTEIGPRRRIFHAVETTREERHVIAALNRAGSVDTPSSEHDALILQDRLDRLKITTTTPSPSPLSDPI
eukprot:TRINITY_DN20567_c0_g1_i1.p1 TRINITY_DN20567_c0_g1~~TRINITY_DN20567_c0_g1_i1.p1  ORF type:complete len:594 (+),score=208.60 TRINITY_DN20567_c0_g1_i1:31-1782(+)